MYQAVTPQGSPVNEGEIWQFNKSLKECNRHMLESGLAADVTFRVSNANAEVCTFRAHKYVLISRSPVFYSMLCGDLTETGDIIVTDIEPQAFRQMLSYIYTDNIDLKPDLVMFILNASKKYLLPCLTKKCTKYLANNINTSDVCIVFDHSRLFQEMDLAERCIKLIKHRTREALDAESSISISQNTLSKILDIERFSVPEVDVFKFSLKWAEVRCKDLNKDATGENIREVLGDCIYKIRFPTLRRCEFADIVGLTSLLTSYEEGRIMNHLKSKKNTPAPGWVCQGRFKTQREISTTETPKLCTLDSAFFNITVVSNQDIKVKSLVFGDSYGCNRTFRNAKSRRQMMSMLVMCNQDLVIGKVSNHLGENKVEWKVSNMRDFIIKAGVEATFQIRKSCVGKDGGEYYVICKKEFLMRDDLLEMKVTSNDSAILLFALTYKFV